ncbi:glycosyltransferase family 4 protein [Pleomorphomonas sp. NRK KF1]|uniref:glycosyltransferase family 4 protein n=1 Tax=Pleomorphomonas sp. NRK KF1 TaxID=2943000 RepID=UPI002042FEB2|nr:glycosyltransferase family 4 protein [Pleomorphomonas sp. NRK KF1]MCM5555944.1 glycosyltransferase family 4 protein [Pleomorphomonas sp. NRK KF1]
MRNKLVYISTRWPWPIRSGREFMISQGLNALNIDYDITYVYIGEKYPPEIPKIIKDVVVLKPPSPLQVLVNLISRRSAALQEALFYSPQNGRECSDIVKAVKPDILICDMVRTASYAFRVRDDTSGQCPLIGCDMDDLLSRRYKQLQTSATKVDFFGTYDRSIFWSFIEPMLALARNLVLRQEARRMARRELMVGRSFDFVYLVSKHEANLLEYNCPQGRIIHFPPAIELNHISRRTREDNTDPASTPPYLRVGFIGDMRTSVNQNAALFILDKLSPVMASRNISLIFAGRAPKFLVERFKSANVNYMGFVTKVDDFYGSIDLLLAPYQSGTGIKIKIIEAMAYGAVVLTNSIGVEGLDARAGCEFLIAETVDAYLDALDLARLPGIRTELSRNARAYIDASHSLNDVTKSLLSFLRALRKANELAAAKEAGPTGQTPISCGNSALRPPSCNPF